MAKEEMTSKFRALYYPFSRCLRLSDLKRAALVFDEILFVDPLSSDIIGLPGQGVVNLFEFRKNLDMGAGHYDAFENNRQNDDMPTWYEIVDQYDILKKKGIVKLLSPQTLLKGEQDIMAYSLLNDFTHHVFTYGVTRAAAWKVHKSRIPDSLVSLLRKDEVLDMLDERVAEESFENMVKREQLGWLLEFLNMDNDFELPQNRKAINLKAARFVLGGILMAAAGRIPNKDILLLPVDIAYHLILNQALLLCEKLDAFPITDDPYAHQGLLNKLDRMYTDKSVKSILPKTSLSDLYRIQSFTLTVVSRLIPEETLNKLTIEQIIELKNSNDAAYQRFQDKMLEMAAEITRKPWDTDFQEDVLRLVDGKVLPEIRRLDDEIKNSCRRLFGIATGKLGSEILKGVASTLPTMTMAVFLGLSPRQVVMLSAASFMSGIGIVLPDVIASWQERKKSMRNGLAFLLNF